MRLINVLPPTPDNDGAYCGRGYAELTRNLRVRLAIGGSFANLRDSIIIELRHGIRCTSYCIATALRDHISEVISSRSQKQMCRIDAWRVIASVQDAQAVRDWTVMQLPRDVGRPNPLTVDGETTILLTFAYPLPDPTVIAYDDVCPESLFEGNFECLETCPRAEIAASIGFATLDLERRMTVLAGTSNTVPLRSTEAYTRAIRGFGDDLRWESRELIAAFWACVDVTLRRHRSVPSSGATPRAVQPAPWLIHAQIIPHFWLSEAESEAA